MMNHRYKLLIALASFFVMDFSIDYFLREGLDRSFGLNQESELFVVGHSHMLMGVDKDKLETGLGCKVSKYTRPGVTLPERCLMTQQYLNSGYAGRLKVALVGVDAFSFSASSISRNSHTLFYPFYEDSNVDRYLAEQASPLEYWQHRIIRSSRYRDDLVILSVRGWKQDDRNYKTERIDMEEFQRQRDKWKSSIGFDRGLMQQLDSLIGMLTRRDVRVYLVNTPTLDSVNHAQPELYDQMMDYYRGLANRNERVEFVDFSDYESRYDLFVDPLHLNVCGQTVVTDSLVKLLRGKIQ